MTDFFPVPGCRVDQVVLDSPDCIYIAAHCIKPGARCPDCGRASRSVHSRYHRQPANLPSLGRATHTCLRVRRFYCRNTVCKRRTFAEQLPELVDPHARRTRRLGTAQVKVGVALGGEAGSRLLGQLQMPASADTVLRLIRHLPMPEPDAPRIVGVDDWAMRKGRTYGTIVVDLERRRVADLLPDRSVATVADWLQQRPEIEVVTRDRSTEYARAIATGAPKAVQVADRWHLLSNVRDMLERWLARTHARLRLLPVPAGHEGRQPGQRIRAYRRSAVDEASSADSRAHWLAAYNDVRRRHLAGEALLAIGRATGLARATVRKYAYAESFPERAVRRPGRSNLDPYLTHLEARLADGCEDAMALWREVSGLGYPGGRQMVQRWVAEHRSKPASRTARKWLPSTPASAPSATTPDAAAALPSPKQLGWLLVQPATALSPLDAAAVAQVEQDKEAALVASLARRFSTLVRGCGVRQTEHPVAPLADFNAWLTEARACGVGAVETFATGLEQDGAAVRAALTLPWSNGQAEGQVNRLKLLKRQCYGRASFDLLHRRVLMAA